jgi:hypothetical protein
MTINLTTIGSRIIVSVGPAALPEADGGIAIRYELFDGPLLVTFTREEAQRLVAAIDEELDAGAQGTPVDRVASFYNTTDAGPQDGRG